PHPLAAVVAQHVLPPDPGRRPLVEDAALGVALGRVLLQLRGRVVAHPDAVAGVPGAHVAADRRGRLVGHADPVAAVPGAGVLGHRRRRRAAGLDAVTAVRPALVRPHHDGRPGRPGHHDPAPGVLLADVPLDLHTRSGLDPDAGLVRPTVGPRDHDLAGRAG